MGRLKNKIKLTPGEMKTLQEGMDAMQEEYKRLVKQEKEGKEACKENLLDSDGMFPDDDKINPTHYQSLDKDLEEKGIDAIICMRAAFGTDAVADFCICNALKYLWRHESKGGKTDLLKCKWYIDKYIELSDYE